MYIEYYSSDTLIHKNISMHHHPNAVLMEVLIDDKRSV